MGRSNIFGERGRREGRGARGIAAGVALVLGVACAPKQVIPLHVEPVGAEVFLDGQAVEGAPSVLKLRRDQDHKLYFKHPGYRPEMVILRRSGPPENPWLEPERIEIRLIPLTGPARKDLKIEIEDAP